MAVEESFMESKQCEKQLFVPLLLEKCHLEQCHQALISDCNLFKRVMMRITIDADPSTLGWTTNWYREPLA